MSWLRKNWRGSKPVDVCDMACRAEAAVRRLHLAHAADGAARFR